MKDITGKTQSYYRYDGKFYIPSKRTALIVNDIFFDGRDYSIKMIESIDDLSEMSFVAPELYCILEQTTIQD